MDRTKWMFEVDTYRTRIVDGKRAREWLTRKVDEVDKTETVRCAYCQGEVRLHQGDVGKWHAQHIHIEDAIKCPGSPEGKVKKRLPPPTE